MFLLIDYSFDFVQIKKLGFYLNNPGWIYTGIADGDLLGY